MDVKLLARIGAIAFVALAITLSALSLRDEPRTVSSEDETAAARNATSDPLAAELHHCQSIGESGATDAQCLATWAESRRRFLAPGTHAETGPTNLCEQRR